MFVGYREAIEWDIFLFPPTGTVTCRRKCRDRARSVMRVVEEIIMTKGKELRRVEGLCMPAVESVLLSSSAEPASEKEN